MFVAIKETANDVNVLLTGLGFDAEPLDTELAIDEFDQWTNPRDAVLIPSSGICSGTAELQRVV